MKKRKTLFSKYFNASAGTILVSISILGLIFIMFASNSFQNDKYEILSNNLEQARILTMFRMTYDEKANSFMVSTDLENYYKVMGESTYTTIYLSDLQGNVILSSERDASDNPFPYNVPKDIIFSIREKDKFTETGKLGGAFEHPQYTVAQTITDKNGQVTGVIFASTSAKILTTFIANMVKMFLLSAFLVMMITILISYMMTKNMVRPLQEMLEATHRFAKGDFSMRVNVEGDDEVAVLCASFNSMASSLATLEQTRRSFTANVSHELKTPMTTIGGFIDGILDGTIPPEKENYYLKIVSSEIQRLSRLVRSMLNISKIEAGELKITPTDVDITDIIIRTTLLFENRLEEKNIEVRGLDTDKFYVSADADLIHQVVYNLIENAVKFVNENGYLEFDFTQQNNKTYVSVRNSGAGITQEEITRVFDRFYKSDKSRSLDKNGVGLGLYIVKTILNLHGGEIFIRSEVGKYTEFVFALPSAQPKIKRKKQGNSSDDISELPLSIDG